MLLIVASVLVFDGAIAAGKEIQLRQVDPEEGERVLRTTLFQTRTYDSADPTSGCALKCVNKGGNQCVTFVVDTDSSSCSTESRTGSKISFARNLKVYMLKQTELGDDGTTVQYGNQNCVHTSCSHQKCNVVGSHSSGQCCDTGRPEHHYCRDFNVPHGGSCRENIECDTSMICSNRLCANVNDFNFNSGKFYPRFQQGICRNSSLLTHEGKKTFDDCLLMCERDFSSTCHMFTHGGPHAHTECSIQTQYISDGACVETYSEKLSLYVDSTYFKRTAGESGGWTTYIIIFGAVAAIVCGMTFFFYVRKQKAKGNHAQPRRIEGPIQPRTRTQRTPRE